MHATHRILGLGVCFPSGHARNFQSLVSKSYNPHLRKNEIFIICLRYGPREHWDILSDYCSHCAVVISVSWFNLDLERDLLIITLAVTFTSSLYLSHSANRVFLREISSNSTEVFFWKSFCRYFTQDTEKHHQRNMEDRTSVNSPKVTVKLSHSDFVGPHPQKWRKIPKNTEVYVADQRSVEHTLDRTFFRTTWSMSLFFWLELLEHLCYLGVPSASDVI